MQPHIRAFVDRAITFTTCRDCGGTRLSKAARSSRIRGINIADACAMQISDLAVWIRGLDEPSVAPLLAALHQTLYTDLGVMANVATTCTRRPRRRPLLPYRRAPRGLRRHLTEPDNKGSSSQPRLPSPACSSRRLSD
jgi:hypothetical protein